MKSVIAAAAIVAFGTTSAAACGWMNKSETVADLDVKTDKRETAMQSTPADASKTYASTIEDRTAETDRKSERLQLAVEPRIEDDAANN